MCKAMEKSDNMKVQYITKLSIRLSKTIRITCRRLNLNNISQLENVGSCMVKKTYIQEYTVEDHITLMVIQELRVCMSNTYNMNGFSFHQIYAIHEYICTK